MADNQNLVNRGFRDFMWFYCFRSVYAVHTALDVQQHSY